MLREFWLRKGLAAPYKIVWRLIWIGPVKIAQFLLVLFVMIGWGPNQAYRVWREVR